MAVEGPLRELGIHDVFQLLDLSRKTGTLRVTSELRDNEGIVYFDNGRVILATIRSNPHPIGTILVRGGKVTEADLARAAALREKDAEGARLGEILVRIGAISARELERQVRAQIEAVVFELMSWREGFFSFEECAVADAPVEAAIRVSTESLLMEGARRIDEWSRIADKVPHLGMIPSLAPVRDDHPSLLDLLPGEWEMLTIIDGVKDLRAIAAELARSEFDIARVAYGLVSTGVVELRAPARSGTGQGGRPVQDPRPHITAAEAALLAGRPEDALRAAGLAVGADPASADARLVSGRALLRLRRGSEALGELRRALAGDPLNAAIYRELGFAAAAEGEMVEAATNWEHYLRLAPGHTDAERVRAALESVTRLREMLEAHTGG
ncbi:MAG: DUF4388 domain-containing protein [Gemmatimonadaceae bacterium]